jgi:RNA polymerase sigma factor (sigma-70 family)
MRLGKSQDKIDIKELALNVAKAKNGDNKALENIIMTTSDFIYYYCLVMLKNEQDAMDATQEIFIIVIQKLNTVKNPKSFLGWLKKVTANYCTNKLNKKDSYFAVNDEDENIIENFEDLDKQRIPEENIDNTETKNLVMGIINELPDSQKECILMYYYQEMPVKDIALAVGVTESTVKSRLYYARSAIKKGVELLEKEGIKLYGGVPYLSYVIHSAASSVTAPTGADAILSAVQSASVLTKIPVDAAVLASVSTAGANAVSTTFSGRIAVGVMAVALVATSGFISVESQINFNGATQTPDTAVSSVDEAKVHNKKHKSTKSTPDTGIKYSKTSHKVKTNHYVKPKSNKKYYAKKASSQVTTMETTTEPTTEVTTESQIEESYLTESSPIASSSVYEYTNIEESYPALTETSEE